MRRTVRRAFTVVGALVLVMAMPLPASAKIEFHRIVYDPPGNDLRNVPSKLRQEMVVLRNTGAKARNLGKWTVRDLKQHVYRLPAGFKLGPGRYVRIHTGKGREDRNDLFWDRGWFVWNNDGGDRATLKNTRGKVIDRCRYSDDDRSPYKC